MSSDFDLTLQARDHYVIRDCGLSLAHEGVRLIKKTLWLAVVVYVFGLLWVSFFQESVPQMNNLCKQRDDWSLRVSKEAAANLELKKEIEGLKNDFRYSERILRQDLLLHKKDELIILVPDDWAPGGS